MIPHAQQAAACPVDPVAVTVIVPSLRASLVAPLGSPPLAAACLLPATETAVLVVPVTMTADPEGPETVAPPAKPLTQYLFTGSHRRDSGGPEPPRPSIASVVLSTEDGRLVPSARCKKLDRRPTAGGLPYRPGPARASAAGPGSRARYRLEPMIDGRGPVDAVEEGCAQFPCPRNLVGGRARPEWVLVRAGQRIPVCGGTAQPGIGEHIIGRHAVSVGVHETEVMWGAGVALDGGGPEPLHSFGIVFGYTLPVVMDETGVGLGLGLTLPGNQPEPAHRFTVVLRNAPAPVMPGKEDLLRAGTALLGLAPDFRNRVLPGHPGRDSRQSQHGDGTCCKYAFPPGRSIRTSVPHTRQGHPGPASIPEASVLEQPPRAGW